MEELKIREYRNSITLKDFRKMMKDLGYTVKTKTTSFSDFARVKVQIVDVYDGKTKITVDCVSKEHYDKYIEVYKIVSRNKITT